MMAPKVTRAKARAARTGWLRRLAVLVLSLAWELASAQTTLERTETRAHPLRDAQFTATLASTETVAVTVVLRLRNRAQLETRLAELTDAASPSFGRWLPRADIERDYLPTAAEVQSVAAYLARAGFRDIVLAPGRVLLSARGGPEAVRRAFHTGLARYRRDGHEGIANTEDVQVPAALQGRVLAVLGLQTLDQLRPMLVPAASVQVTGTVHGVDPSTFPLAYNATGLPAATATAVGILTQGNMTPTIADLRAFETNHGYPAMTPTVITVGSASADTSNQVEWNLDSQSILAMAGGQVKEMRLYTAPTLNNADITSAISRAVSDNVAKVINISLGECETDAQASGMIAATDQLFSLAIAQGQTFSVSTGDSGSSECGNPVGTAVGASYPASSPYVIAVGGTTLSTDAAGNYAQETAWSGTGGSPSLVEPKPAFQNAVVAGNFRGLPDIAFDGDPNSGALILVNGAVQQWGGTSLASPLFVGTWARIQTANKAALGFPATWIYSRGAAGTTAFRDVTSGANGGYAAGPGWDFTTGFGSFDVAATATLTRSTVVVRVSASAIQQGQPVTLTATVSGNQPTGTIQFQVNGINIGAPVTLVNGVATLTTSQLTLVGTDLITALYSGDSNNAGGTSAASAVVTVAGGDVPLPPWALTLMGACLLATALRSGAAPRKSL